MPIAFHKSEFLLYLVIYLHPDMPNSTDIRIAVKGEQLLLSADRVIFHERTRTLIISDLHLGKAEHFRKNGIAVPTNMIKHNLARLGDILDRYAPRELLMLGDAFHSIYNKSWEEFVAFIRARSHIRFSLVEGNHDILPKEHYEKAGIELLGLISERKPFLFIHDTIDDIPENYCVVSGHIHPGIKLYGKGMQTLVLPCFVISENRIIIPAFGAFTGLAKVRPEPGDRVFAIGEGKVVEVQSQSV